MQYYFKHPEMMDFIGPATEEEAIQYIRNGVINTRWKCVAATGQTFDALAQTQCWSTLPEALIGSTRAPDTQASLSESTVNDASQVVTIKCPFCREEIQDGAIKCKHCGEVLNKAVYVARFNFNHLGLGEKIILGSALAAIFSLFMPWIAMGIISSNGWNQQGYLFLVLFAYPVIGVFNVKGLNRIGGIICGAVALLITVWYIADKHYEIMGVSGNASASGLYLFAASTIGLIVGAVKYRQQHDR